MRKSFYEELDELKENLTRGCLFSHTGDRHLYDNDNTTLESIPKKTPLVFLGWSSHVPHTWVMANVLTPSGQVGHIMIHFGKHNPKSMLERIIFL